MSGQLLSSQASRWESEIINKVKRFIRQTGKSIESVFTQIDSDHSGNISIDEFERALKLIGIQLTQAELRKFLMRIDADASG